MITSIVKLTIQNFAHESKIRKKNTRIDSERNREPIKILDPLAFLLACLFARLSLDAMGT